MGDATGLGMGGQPPPAPRGRRPGGDSLVQRLRQVIRSIRERLELPPPHPQRQRSGRALVAARSPSYIEKNTRFLAQTLDAQTT